MPFVHVGYIFLRVIPVTPGVDLLVLPHGDVPIPAVLWNRTVGRTNPIPSIEYF